MTVTVNIVNGNFFKKLSVLYLLWTFPHFSLSVEYTLYGKTALCEDNLILPIHARTTLH